jgi:hypothetical protein
LNTSDRDIPVGIWDEVEITNATETFSSGQSVSYSANFTSGSGDTWPVGWNWYMRLYHEDGFYELEKNENGSSYWSFTTNSSLPNYQWLRDPSGNIYGEVNVVVDINDGDWKSDNVPISVQYKPNQPIVNIASYINDSDPLNNSFTISIDSKGSEIYKVYYTSSNTAHQGSSPISVTNGEVVTLSNLNYFDEFWVAGVNNKGESTFSNKIPVAKYFGLPLTYTRSGDQNLCVTKYESNDDVKITFNSDGSIALDNDGWNLLTSTGGADFHVDLNNEKNVYMEFDWYHYDDEFQDKDGIFLSINGGGSFKKIFTLNPDAYQKNVFHHFKINLNTLAANAGLTLSKATVLRLSHEDNNDIPDDGFLFRNIKFYSSFNPPSPIRNLTLGADKDAMLNLNTKPGYEYRANTNYGAYSMIKTDEWTQSGYRTNTKSLVDFDLSRFPENTVIKSAKLSLYANNPQPNDDYKQMTNYSTGNSGYKSNASWLYRVTENWDENAVTYNACPEVTELNGEYLPVSETYTQNYMNIDVTNVVKDMIQNSDYSYGFMLSLDNEKKYTRMAFASSDHSNSSLHPKLTVEHYINEQVRTVPFTVSGSTSSESDNWDVEYGDGRDKAYLVYVPSTITIDATTCSGSTDYDTKLEIFKADKSKTSFYNDDYNCSYSGLTSSLIGKTLTPGYYYFVVDGYNGDVGNFQLSVSVNSTLKSATLIENNHSEKIEDYPESIEVLIYPNPVYDNLQVVLPEKNTLINIIDLNGKVLKTLKSANTNISINCSDLIQGVYAIQVKTSKSVGVRLFVKQ